MFFDAICFSSDVVVVVVVVAVVFEEQHHTFQNAVSLEMKNSFDLRSINLFYLELFIDFFIFCSLNKQFRSRGRERGSFIA